LEFNMVWLIMLSIAIIVFVIIPKSVKFFVKFLLQSGIGVLSMTFLNQLLYGFGIFVGVNYITVLIAGILGIPGLISMYLLQILF